MNCRLTEAQLAHLRTVGEALDNGLFPHVFRDGFVAFAAPEDAPSMEQEDVERQRTRGPATRSRTRTEAGPRRTSGETAPIGRGTEQAVLVPILEGLYTSYPTQFIEGDHGLWAVVTSCPLGHDGPQVTLVLAYPHSGEVPPRAWAFWKLGDFPKFIGPRHTNFPDASICAFVPDDATWNRSDGLVALVDLYSTWVFRHLYLQHFGRWPGPQHGATALYRRTEFSSDEWCGCESGKRYGECHLTADALLSDEAARAEHRTVMGSDYVTRKPPRSIMQFARSRFKRVPSFRDVFEGR
jgi:hypothetical protein